MYCAARIFITSLLTGGGGINSVENEGRVCARASRSFEHGEINADLPRIASLGGLGGCAFQTYCHCYASEWLQRDACFAPLFSYVRNRIGDGHYLAYPFGERNRKICPARNAGLSSIVSPSVHQERISGFQVFDNMDLGV